MKKLMPLLLMLFFNFIIAQEGVYEILNTSINSKFAEFGVTYSSNNAVIFASSKKDESGRRTNNRQLSLELYHGLIVENGDIIQTDKFSSEINNKFFESDIAFTPDFKTIYFTWNNFYSALKSKDSSKWKTLYMFKASINQNFEISKVTPLPFNSKEYSVRSPVVSKDGKKLYFVSDMPGGFGELDIYVVDINNDGNYGVPKNLGPTVNTKQTEFFPYIDQNNTLYFSSNGYKGLGGLDIFKSEFKNGNFQQAINLPTPFNSKYDDFAYVFDNASNSGYFTSNRGGGKGDVDIYAFKVKEPECAQTITILALSEFNDQPLDRVVISLFQNDKLIEKQTISKGLEFKFNIDCKETYKIVAEKENYEPVELTVLSDDINKLEIKKSLKLTPIECVQLLSGIVVNSITNLPVNLVSVSLFQNNVFLEKQIVGINSSYKFKITCKETYKLIAEKENYETVSITITSDGKNYFETAKPLKLIPIICSQLLSGNISDIKTNLALDQVTVSLFQNNKLIEKQTISKGLNFKFNIDCKQTYKIIAEKENYAPVELTISSDDKNKSEITKSLKLTPIECNQLLSGNISDSKTNLPLDQVAVSLFQNDKLIIKQTISKGLEFKFNIDCKQTYKLVAEKENYETAELAITTDDKYNFETKKSLKLTPIECNQLLIGNILDNKTNMALDQVAVSLFQNDKLIEKQTISKGLDFKFSIDCKQTYKLVAEKENYETSELAITTNDKYNFETKKSLKLTPIECKQLLIGNILDSKTNLQLDQVTVSIFQNNKLIEKQTISKGLEFKFNIDCKQTYKLVAEKENYETSELTFTTDDKNKSETKKSLKLTPMECVQLLSGNISDSKTNLALDQVTVSLFQNDRLIEKQTISKGLDFKFNIDCKETYKIVAEKENYETAELAITTDDKYNFETKKSLRLALIECVQLLSGNILDSKTNLALDQVTVSLFQNNKLIEKQTISKGLEFKFNVNCKETYKIVSEKENYETAELTISTDDKNKSEITKSLRLTPIECNQLLSGNILDSKTNLALDQVTVSLFQNDRLIEKQTISKGLEFKFNIDCKQTYKLVAEKENYETSELTFTTDDKNKSETKKSLKLTPIECNQLLSGNISDSKTNLPIDQVHVSLFQNDKLVEKQTISKGLEFKFNVDCKQIYKIVAEKENYETSELAITTDDKYNFETKKSLKLTPSECNQLLSGNILDNKTNMALDQVTVSLFQNDKLVDKQTIGKGLDFKFSIDCKQTYKIVSEKENYETAELTISTDDKNKSAIKKSLKLTPNECNQLLSGNVSDSKTNLSIDQVTVSLFQNNKIIDKQTVRKGLEFKFNIDCKETYKIVAEKENYETSELAVSSGDKNKLEITKMLKLTAIECTQLLSGNILDSKTNLTIDQVIVSLFQNGKLIEKQTISKGLEFKFNIDCKETYKIVAEKENYETSELTVSSDDKNKSEITKTLKLTPIECNQLLSGNISDSKTNLTIDQVIVSLFQNGKLIEKQTISKGSNYKFNINCKETYKILAEKENYEPVELTVSSDDKNKSQITKTLKLTQIECIQLLSGIVTDSETNLPLSSAIVHIYKGKELLAKISLDENATFSYKLECVMPYRITVSLNNYHNLVSTIKTSDKINEALNIKLEMESSVEFVEVREQKMIKTKTIYFDLDQSSIRLDAAIELNKVIAVLSKYPSLKIEIKSHTDSRASAEYNMKLTNDRAKKVIDYIISNGIDSSRVSGRGYGETQLLNNCSKGVKCSEAEHQLNRRTEFIITDE